MNDLPCLCAATYRCNQCRARDWHAKREPTRLRMRDNKLTALARNGIGPWVVTDDEWSQRLYDNESDDLDLLLFQGDAS